MPVPVTPQKPVEYSPPSPESDSSVELELPFSSGADPCVVAGYEDCLRETIRFLVQEEQLPAEHPLVAGLNFHLTSGTAHQELLRISEQLAERLNDDLRSRVTSENGADSGVDSSFSDEEEMPCTQAYEITLEEEEEYGIDEMEDDVEEEEEEEEEEEAAVLEENLNITAKDILSDPFIRNTLIRFVFQGCDLVVSPPSSV